ncbi:hypothetical protein Tco_1015481 [Tanacetum coccineum]|uniref:Uncharacterized protein n=1 Tax=Tanacetum coccineum TaxID=301880 RepID=A0ABQ5FL04_9ASTR
MMSKLGFRYSMALPNEQHLTIQSQYWMLNLCLLPLKQDLESLLTLLHNLIRRSSVRHAILVMIIAQEDLNLKFLSSLPPEWNTHVVVWMNKPEVETMSIDDLYNNFKIVEQKVKKIVANAASPSVNTVYALMVENPNGSNVLHQDLEQIHEDDLETIDLKWWSVTTVISWDTLPGSAEHQEARKSDMAEEQVQTNMTLMVFLDSEVYTNKTCLKNYETLKKQYDDLLAKLHQTEFKATTYKRGLDTVEAQLVTYRKNEVLFSEEVAVLKREVGCKQYEINMLKTEFEKVKQEKDGIDFKINKFDKALKDLDQLLGIQITDKSKKGLRYSAVPPPHPLIYNRPNKLDLSYSGLDEFKEPEFKGYGPENIKEQISQDKSSFVEGYKPNTSKSVSEVEPKKVRKNVGAPIIEDWVSDDEEQDESKPKSEKKTVIPTAAKIELVKPENHEKQVKSQIRICRNVKITISYGESEGIGMDISPIN